ncbi:metallophosphoesterase [Alysiella sp.]|uniref:metallophosphoesterase n=1 Tax=Alysiella sp. TaxID=1872483 RepID=UPI0034C65C16
MKTLFFPIFILTVLQVFNYVFARALIWQFALHHTKIRRIVIIGIFLLSNGLILFTFTRIVPSMFRISANWLVLLLFTLFTTIIVSSLSFALRRFRQPEHHQRHLRLFAPLLLIGIYALALYNAYTPIVRYQTIHINKYLDKPIRIGLASDTHLGALFGNKQIDDLVAIMQREQVDMIFLPGDIMDDNTQAYEAQNMGEHLRHLRAPLGVYATIGNHDVGYSGQPQNEIITQTLEQAGITVLTNRAVQVNQQFWVVGLPDQLMREGRQTAAQVLQQTDTSQPIFLLDHRPDNVIQHAQLPIDLQVSGHVHNGQVFPANLIVRFLNRIHYGYEQINHSHFVVTSGYGFWGVPFRLGSQSEVWIIDVVPSKSNVSGSL